MPMNQVMNCGRYGYLKHKRLVIDQMTHPMSVDNNVILAPYLQYFVLRGNAIITPTINVEISIKAFFLKGGGGGAN